MFTDWLILEGPVPTESVALAHYQARQKMRERRRWSDPTFQIVFRAWMEYDARQILPYSGGFMEQPIHLMTAFDAISDAKWRAEKAHQRRAEQTRKREAAKERAK